MGHSHPFSYSYLGCSAIPQRAQHWREDNVLRSCDEIGTICSNIKWRFPEIGVPPIIQNQTTLVLKPMVLGYPHFRTPNGPETGGNSMANHHLLIITKGLVELMGNQQHHSYECLPPKIKHHPPQKHGKSKG